MVDLETLGNGSRAVIVAIGAVRFNSQSVFSNTFYRLVDAESCVRAGLKMDASTVMWWLKQSQAAREALCKPGVTLTQALTELSAWYPHDACLWGNGATFDNVILDNAYKAIKMSPPWQYYNHRCYRTVKALFPLAATAFNGTAHNALDDAIHQAEHLITIAASTRA